MPKGEHLTPLLPILFLLVGLHSAWTLRKASRENSDALSQQCALYTTVPACQPRYVQWHNRDKIVYKSNHFLDWVWDLLHNCGIVYGIVSMLKFLTRNVTNPRKEPVDFAMINNFVLNPISKHLCLYPQILVLLTSTRSIIVDYRYAETHNFSKYWE